MVRRKNREDRYIEDLEDKVRELKSEVRRLTKRLARVNKGYRKSLAIEEETDSQEDEKIFDKDTSKKCFNCGGELRVVYFMNRRLRICQQCSKRTKVKIINN